MAVIEGIGGAEIGAASWARLPLTRVQAITLHGLIVVLVIALVAVPHDVAVWMVWIAVSVHLLHSLFFFAIWLAGSGRLKKDWPRRADEDLPVYTVLAPLYREGNMAAGILLALARLDYPPERLDVLLAVEADDDETLQAVGRVQLPHWARVCVVPLGTPRTKPRACNHALAMARGAFVVVYDAEDRPEPGQLRDAIAAFDAHGPSVACVQARLVPFNAHESFVARMFALDYCQWFDWMLPGLERLGFPIPLGGTSNHFRREVLEASGAWDPFNVTEDADLGMRLARLGHGTRTIASTTFEEAPLRLWPWLKQRTRWTKGYIQTFFVHMRSSSRLGLPALKAWDAAFLVFFVGGSVAFALLNPVLWTMCAIHMSSGALDGVFDHGLTPMAAAFGGLLIGNAVAIARAALSPLRRGWWGLAGWGLLVPLYWVMLSLAAYRAVYGFLVKPFEWEKTTHGVTHIVAGDIS